MDMYNSNPYNLQSNGFYQYNGQATPQQYKFTNPLSAEEIDELTASSSDFNLGLTHKESLQAACNHRSKDGTRDTLQYDPVTGIARCTICGYEFRPIEAETSIETISEAVNRVVDILQTTKLLYIDLPGNAAREYYQILPLIMKLPEFFKFAAKNYAKHEINAWNYQNSNMSGINMLQALGNMLGSPIAGMAGQPNPQMGGMWQQPMGMGQPQPQVAPMGMGYPNQAYAPQTGAPYGVQPGMNPFGAPGAGQVQPQPYQYTPGAVPPPPVAPTVSAPAAPAPATAEAANTTGTETVNAQVTV